MAAQYRKLPDGTWGIASFDRLELGKKTTVAKRSGEAAIETVGEFKGASSFDNAFLYTLGRRTEAAATSPVGDMAGVVALFERARAKLRYPTIVLQVSDTITIRMGVAGEKAAVPGSLTITSDTKDPLTGRRDWYGRVRLNGVFETSRDLDGASAIAIDRRLRELAADPARVATEHGRLTGRCCFCNLPLKDERSTEVGYGRTCASHFGLPWGAKPVKEVPAQATLSI